MVRKRGRQSRKYYESEEDNDSSDFELEEPSQPAPKKYSLRERKRPLFTEDFDYDDDDDDIAPKTKNKSEDEDFSVEDELPLSKSLDPSHEYTKNTQYNYDNIPEQPDELIDFEDIIRADIVVNKRRIDYDNAISKSEIKFDPANTPQSTSTRGRRGRKPKKLPEYEIDSNCFEPELGIEEEGEDYNDKNDCDYVPEDETECTVDTEKVEEIKESTDLNHSDLNRSQKIDSSLTTENNHQVDRSAEVDAVNSNDSEKTEHDSDTSGKMNGNIAEKVTTQIQQNQNIIEDEDDDDVVLIEDASRCEIIVLDD